MAPDLAPTGIVIVIEVGVISEASGLISSPPNFTLSTELKLAPLITTVVPAPPEVTDSPVTRGIADNGGVLSIWLVDLTGEAEGVGVV